MSEADNIIRDLAHTRPYDPVMPDCFFCGGPEVVGGGGHRRSCVWARAVEHIAASAAVDERTVVGRRAEVRDLGRRMAARLAEEYKDFAATGWSSLGVDVGLGDRNGIIRLTIADVGRICAREALGVEDQEQP